MDDKWAKEPDTVALWNSFQKLNSNPLEGIRELRELAAQGSLMSMVYIGYAHQRGKGLKKDLAEAERWYRRAYEKGSLEGLRHLGIVLTEMERTDDAEAVFLEGVSKDYSPVMHRLAKIYLASHQPERWKKAIPVLERGTQLGHVFAKRTLAGLLLTGRLGLGQVPRGMKLFAESIVEAFRLGRTEPNSDQVKF
jgi:TPR repeat protein